MTWGTAGTSREFLVDSVLAVAVVANLVSYVLSIEPGTVLGTGYDAREIAAVLPLGAVLAGRTLGPKITALLPLTRGCGCKEAEARAGGRHARRVIGPGRETRIRSGASFLAVLTFVLAGYPVAFGYAAAQPAAVSGDAVLAEWLVGHGLRYGLGGASANVVTTLSGGRAVVQAVAVRQGRVGALLYQSAAAAYDPGLHDATFLVAGTPPGRAGDPGESVPDGVVRATFGEPRRVYRFDGYTIDVWDVNLLTKLPE